MTHPNFTLLRDNEMQARALARLAEDERAREQQAQQEASARDAVAWAEIARAREQAEAQAVKQLAELKGVYAERDELARAAIDALERFCDLDAAMRETLNHVDDGLREHWYRVDPMQRPARWRAMRQRAGLAESHRQLGVPLAPKSPSARRAAAAIAGILSDAILPGAIVVRGQQISFGL